MVLYKFSNSHPEGLGYFVLLISAHPYEKQQA